MVAWTCQDARASYISEDSLEGWYINLSRTQERGDQGLADVEHIWTGHLHAFGAKPEKLHDSAPASKRQLQR